MEIEARLRTALAERYTIEGEIGKGGMGVVFRAQDLRHCRTVAIKVLRPEIASAVGPERFDREIRIEAQLQHPHIVPLFDSGTADGLSYFVMPFIEGETLRRRIEREGPLPFDDALQIVDQVADALGYAHARGVIHRDIKPENILLADGHAHVADFGIARVIYEGGEPYFTATGTALGTPPYMSPEQATGSQKLDGRSDIYSLACVLFEMLAGEPPFPGHSAQVIISKHVLEPPPSVEILRPTVTPSVSAALKKALAKLPVDRFATVPDFQAALRSERPVTVPTSAKRRHEPRRWMVASGAIGVVVALALVARFWPTTAPLDARRVVVFPLAATIRGVDEARLGWDAALAIEAALEHTEPLRWLDGWAYLAEAIRAAPHLLTPEMARAVTRGAGARYYLTGVVRGDTTNPAVTLWLHDAAADSVVRPATQAGVGLSTALLAVRALEPLLPPLIEPGRQVDLTPLTQRAQGAIALMLQGDRAYRRSHFLEALDFYKRAVAEDSFMALAAVKGAQTASWAARTEHEGLPLLEVAMRARSLLPERHQAFVDGLEAYYTGRVDVAMGKLREAVRADPDWAEAWMALGEVFYHTMPRTTRFEVQAEDAFRRAIQTDSLFSPPLVHLAQIDARRGDVPAAAAHAARYEQLAIDSTYNRELKLILRCLTDGPGAFATAPLADSVVLVMASMSLASNGARLDCAEAGYRRLMEFSEVPPAHRAAYVLGLVGVLMANGEYAEIDRLLDSSITAGYLGGYPIYFHARLLDAPLDQRVAAGQRLMHDLAGPLYQKARQSNRWLMGLVHLREDSVALAGRVAEVMQESAASSGNPFDRVLADALAAHVAIAWADTGAALDRFARLNNDVPALLLAWDPATALIPTRILQVEVLLARGRRAEADSILQLLEHPEPVWGVAALPQIRQLRRRLEQE